MSSIFNALKEKDAASLGLAAMPGIFVLLWSTGFIGAKFGLPYAEPFTFLFIRFVLTLMLLIPLTWLMRISWPSSPRLWKHIAVSGLLVHGTYLGGVFYGIYLGMPAGLAALLVGLQPLLTATCAGPLLGERLTKQQWLGLLLGLIGISLVLGSKLELGSTLSSGFGAGALISVMAALAGISLGTLYQKRYCTSMPLLSGAVIQYIAAGVLLGFGALLFESREVEWSMTFILTLGWLVLILSIAAILLLMALIKKGEASRVASLFYLVPPVTALQAWWLFDERLPLLGLAGMVIAIIGVVMVVRPSTT
ncbi:DMT family transporter [Vreelandella aquamarina]|jgi:drug/metabolite transporter (DMT)-like permease|uniref:DMT family transporter n=1 Tax=Vreelandella aquamarina TaxID=77097 RepID=UPI0005CBB99D|nr:MULTISPECIES: DMT family transporter [Halomonas]KJD18022.1 peptide ABC transporter ATP-binding protein [Halomonas meridiana]MCC4289660.1 DMT family transporter [Halomonas axialensis]MCD1651454.1 DMT family transporter [Halomonas axialensis]MCD2089234.1 DMT family transporter [Halomonas meridiana]